MSATVTSRCRNRRRNRGPLAARFESADAGFTMVEMLVAVTLVLIMMMMFAEVFEIASGMHHRVRGLARNDQRARIMQNIIESDIRKRTFRHMVPFARNETGYGRDLRLGERQGYLYISENNPNDDSDDVLQLTIRSTILRTDSDPTPYYGLLNASPLNNLARNQQETLISSTSAEVCYFLRNGILYRRVLMLYESTGGRLQPFDDNNNSEVFDSNHPAPYLPSNQSAFNAGTDNTANTRDDKGNFWKDFDFSAQYTSTGAKLHNRNSLVNSRNASNYPLAIPAARFGHNHDTGLPREFAPGPGPDGLWSTTADNGPFFIGRFTHEETSNYYFRYPQIASRDSGGNLINDGNPTKTQNVSNNPLAVGEDGVINQYRGGPRRAEDILMTNVHSFDVKVWDGVLGRFVDIGHAGGTGDFRLAGRLNSAYGPGGPWGNRVYDTWHQSIDQDGDGIADPPPYRVTHYSHRISSGSRRGPWAAATAYKTEDLNGNNTLDPGEDTNNNGVLDIATVFPPNEAGGPLVFRCMATTGAGVSKSLPPNWPAHPGALVTETEDLNKNQILDMGEDTNSNGQLDSVTWKAIDNWLPLRAIQITIRYRDPNSELMRQMTQVHSLTR